MSTHNNGLIGLRVLATLLVAVFHFELYYSFQSYKIFNGSYLCVEFFFILSGFFLSRKVFSKKNTTFVSFLRNRMLRLYPAYIFSLMALPIVYAVEWYNGSYLSWLTEGDHLKSFLTEVFLLQSLGLSDYNFINGPSWYVSSLLLISLLFFGLKTWLFKLNKFLWLFISISAYLYIYLSGSPSLDPEPWAFLRGLAGISLGIFLEQNSERIRLLISKGSFFILSALEIVALLWFISFLIFRTEDSYNIFVIIPISFLILIMINENIGIVSILFKSKFLIYFEKISFQFYIAQSFCLNVFTCILTQLKMPYVFIYYLLLNFLVAVFIYEVIENRFIPFLLNQKK